ncbi:hypothetical protein VTK73DRAFT_9172 [Phialemonium thermophilum]|uniref:C3H1-type domain-containing protein n=1 Tax=Phialemonium thermophilum TaxID=223376 RepID=A0ABR3W433_9PEZI
MSSEEQEMMARISQLAGRINRHKSQQAGTAPSASHPHQHHPYRAPVPAPAPHPQNHHHGPGYAGSGWRRGAGYGASRVYRGGSGKPVYRHKSLVLNGARQPAQSTEPDSGVASESSNSSWVSKNDRHLQLINASVYEKDAQARAQAIEQTRQQKMALKDERERAKLMKHINRVVNSGGSTNPQASTNKFQITVQGIPFLVVNNGSKLVKAPGDNNSAKATPKTAVVGGVKFYRSKNGNLYRHGIVKAQRRSGIVKKVNVPCRMFSTTGSCSQGPRCRYIHDPSKVAICKDFLQKGECANGDSCDLSHDLTPERTPTCLHFAKDNCTNPNCRYAHVKVSPGALVCRPFGIFGYCEKGAACPDRHAFECPDFSNTGVCKTKGCKLLHRERASVLRKMNAAEKNGDDESMEDVSSDEDGDSVDSYDVDSDEVEEFIGQDDNFDFTEQKDFIEL